MSWFRSVAEAMVKYGSKALAGSVPYGEVLLDVVKDLWEKYRKPRQGAGGNLVADLQAVAAAPAAANQKSIVQAVQDVAGGQPPEIKKALTEYLAQAPYAIRRSLRRPSDPSGTSVPAALSLQQARDLVPLLPAALPRFKAGDRPLPGVPLVLEELLGKGGFGEVWLARHPRDDSLRTALKFCLDEKAAQSLRHEARALRHVRGHGKHAGIVSCGKSGMRTSRSVWNTSMSRAATSAA